MGLLLDSTLPCNNLSMLVLTIYISAALQYVLISGYGKSSITIFPSEKFLDHSSTFPPPDEF